MEQQKCAVGAVCTPDVSVAAYPTLAMVYVPIQQFRELYDEAVGLDRGTLFRELDKPFGGGYRGCGNCGSCGNGGARR